MIRTFIWFDLRLDYSFKGKNGSLKCHSNITESFDSNWQRQIFYHIIKYTINMGPETQNLRAQCWFASAGSVKSKTNWMTLTRKSKLVFYKNAFKSQLSQISSAKILKRFILLSLFFLQKKPISLNNYLKAKFKHLFCYKMSRNTLETLKNSWLSLWLPYGLNVFGFKSPAVLASWSSFFLFKGKRIRLFNLYVLGK